MLRVVAALIEPVMPETTAGIRKMLGIPPQNWTNCRTQRLQPGTRLGKIEPLFPRVDKTVEEIRQMADQEASCTSN